MSGVERSDRKTNRDKNKRPGSGVDRVSNSLSTWTCSSCRLRCLLLGYAFCLWAFLSLDNFELDIVALLEALIALRLDGTIVDEHIRAVIPADKAEALCVIEPFHFAFNSRHDPYSGRSLDARLYCGPREPAFLLLVFFATAIGRDAGHRRYPLRCETSYTRYFGFGFILRLMNATCQLI